MKKLLKRTAITLTALFAFLGMGTVAAFAAGVLTWDGHNSYLVVKQNLVLLDDLLSKKEQAVKDLETTQANKQKEIDDLNKIIVEKETLIVQKNAVIAEKEAALTAASATIETAEDELDLATKEMKDLENNSKAIVNKH